MRGDQARIVYVVDDDDALRRTAVRLLTSSGFAAEDFASGEQLLDAVEELAPGCILLDVRMPGLGGLQVQEILVQRGIIMPLVMLTGFADVDDAVAAMKAGAVDYLQKPFTRDTLLKALSTAFDRLEQQASAVAAAADAEGRLASLTRREREVLHALSQGLQNKVVAHSLGLSPRTVEVYRATLMKKLGVRSLAEAVRILLAAGTESGAVAPAPGSPSTT